MTSLSRLFARYRREEDGYMVIEAVLVIPFLLWSYLALYTYWDAYRAMTVSQKASYTISDMISREQLPVNAAYITGMKRTMDYMLYRNLAATLRVSSVAFEQDDNSMRIEWSRSTANATHPALTTATLQPMRDSIPAMSDGDTIILVETWVPYEPSLRIGLEEGMTFQEFIVTRPRFAPRITFQ